MIENAYYQGILEDVYDQLKANRGIGELPNYIPELSQVNKNDYAISLVDIHGNCYCVGDFTVPFSIQSITKVYALLLVYEKVGKELWNRVNVEPSGNPFNSLVQLEYENGIPRNPFINAGALLITDVFLELFEDPIKEIEMYLSIVCGSNSIRFDEKVALSEYNHSHRNQSLLSLMKSFGNIKGDINKLIEIYCKQCSLELDVCALAKSFMPFANQGMAAGGSKQLISETNSKRLCAIMTTCGLYDEAGEFLYRVGLPAKSGVGGGIVAVKPNEFTIAVYSPGLNEKGNSMLGMKTLELFTTMTGITLY